MKTDGATGPLGRSIIYIYSSRSKNIFIKCKCMTTISPFVGRILTTENLWCSQFPSFRFFWYSDKALHFPGLIQWHGCSSLICCQVPEEKRTDRRSVGWWRVFSPQEGNFHQLKQIHLRGDLHILLSEEKSTKRFPWRSSGNLSSGPRPHQHFRNRTTINLGEKRSKFTEYIPTHI